MFVESGRQFSDRPRTADPDVSAATNTMELIDRINRSGLSQVITYTQVDEPTPTMTASTVDQDSRL